MKDELPRLGGAEAMKELLHTGYGSDLFYAKTWRTDHVFAMKIRFSLI
jgi:hypothetical protein